jgi:COP9 signalosome complex subunit 7
LERQIADIKSEALKRHKEEQEWNTHVDKLMEGKTLDNVKNEEGGGRWGLGKRLGGGGAKRNGGMGLGMGDAFDDDDMDVDDEDLEVEEKKRGTKRGFGTLSFGK